MEYNPKCTAVIVIDMQNDFCHPDGTLYAEASEEAIEGVNDVLDATEDVTLTIFTQDSHDNNAAEFEQWGEHCVHGTWGQEIHDDVNDVADRTVKKNTYDAFFNTDLPRVLSVNGIDDVIICGTLANVCVQETASSAALHGYDVSVVGDAVGYINEEQRDSALDHIDFLFGEVISTEDL
jgi:nicotinamidase-related amidase